MLTIREDLSVLSHGNVAAPLPSQPSSPVTLQDHLKRAPLRGIEIKDHVFTEGESKSHIYQVVTGAVCLYKVLPDGRRQVIDFAYGGDILSLGLGVTETYNAQATVATRVRCLPVSAFSGLARRDPAIAMRMCEAMSDELAAVRDHLICVVQRSATERLVTFLLALSRRSEARSGDPLTIELPMTRADIGDFLGLTIETVSRTFTKLKCLGLIEINQGTTIRLSDIGGLKAMASGVAGK
jgi:CRP/FNR family transcriptional regulator, anaerobic regulatory protein